MVTMRVVYLGGGNNACHMLVALARPGTDCVAATPHGVAW